MDRIELKSKRIKRRRRGIRKVIAGSPQRPRLAVFRSNRHIYAQIVDDVKQNTIVGCSTLSPTLKDKCSSAAGKVDSAKIVGEQIALLAKEKGIEKVQFDRNGRRYHGRVKAVADGARSGGLKF